MDMKIIIATRSRNDALYAKASAFWPADIPRHRVQHMHGWREAADYLWGLTQLDADLVVNCDEDCFVHYWGVVETLLHIMTDNGVAYAGMPDDRSNCRHRNNARSVHNPFFSVYAPALIRAAVPVQPNVGTNPPDCRMHEPFNSLYAAMRSCPGLIELCGQDHPDGISTSLSYNDRPFALHSWYSRDYEGAHRARIDALHAESVARRAHREEQIRPF